MKISAYVLSLAFLLPSFSIFAAQTVPGSVGQQIGVVSVSGIRGDMDDAVQALQIKGREMGGHRIKIISLDSPGDSATYLGTAEVFAR